MPPVGGSSGRGVAGLQMGCLLAPPGGMCGVRTACGCPVPPRSMGQRLGEHKAPGQRDGAVLDGARAALAGSGAADARYAGPSGVLSVVANRPETRRLSTVLDHAPTHDALPTFVGRWPTAWVARAV